ncbi:MAG: heptosyltransferase I [Thiomicrorhabdus sp.]|nr:MAG: heptosyltransferase I [Thiomicrorhabdus sp.]
MRVLLIKMSSMGDVFHTFPALSDAQAALPGLTVDWVVEEGFAEIPTWHPVVDKVYPIALREWRKSLWSKQTRSEIKAFFTQINQTHYDLILDAQGLLKSLWVAKKVKGSISGYDWQSVREPLASLFYHAKYPVVKEQHAILRLRQLFAQALNYELIDNQAIEYGLDTVDWHKPKVLTDALGQDDYVVFLHGTTWESKYWPEDRWIALLAKMNATGLKVVLPWGNLEEQQRAERIEQTTRQDLVWVPEKPLSLNTVSHILNMAKGVVSVDTGLSHVAAALEVPMVVMYRVTDPKLVGADGSKVIRLQSPCASMYLKKFDSDQQEETSLEGLSVNEVFNTLMELQP